MSDNNQNTPDKSKRIIRVMLTVIGLIFIGTGLSIFFIKEIQEFANASLEQTLFTSTIFIAIGFLDLILANTVFRDKQTR